MNHEKFCQSCGMPLDTDEIRGTEINGAKNPDYCIYCYNDGRFSNPDMTLSEMSDLVSRQMEKMKIDSPVIDLTLRSLPYLKRWKN